MLFSFAHFYKILLCLSKQYCELVGR